MMCSLNSIEEMRLRIVGNEVRLYDVIHPTYTVMTKLEVFDNCKNLMYDSYPHFYQACQRRWSAQRMNAPYSLDIMMRKCL